MARTQTVGRIEETMRIASMKDSTTGKPAMSHLVCAAGMATAYSGLDYFTPDPFPAVSITDRNIGKVPLGGPQP